MFRFMPILLIPIFLTSCSKVSLPPDAERIANLVQMNSEMRLVQLEFSHHNPSPRHEVFNGCAVDVTGVKYDLVAEVTTDTVHWWATPKLQIASREDAEETVKHAFSMSEVKLNEVFGTYVGFGEDTIGNRFSIRAYYASTDAFSFSLDKRRFSMELLDEAEHVIRTESRFESKCGEFEIR